MSKGLEDQLHQAIIELIHREVAAIGKGVIPATVVSGSVDESKRTLKAEPQDGGPAVRVNLQGNRSSDKGWVNIPEDGSTILIGFLDESVAFLVLTTEVKKVMLDTDKFEINGGNNGGLINIEDLVNDVNSIKQDINTLKQVFTSWSPVSNDGGAALKTAASTWYGQQLSSTSKQDYEDEKITH